jgi:hypothetical protein
LVDHQKARLSFDLRKDKEEHEMSMKERHAQLEERKASTALQMQMFEFMKEHMKNNK